MSLDFERCPISELTTHSPRMVNQPLLCTHTRLNAMLPCIWDARMPHNMSYIFSNSWHEILIHHVNISARMHRHKISKQCMLFKYQEITRKRSLNWDLNPTRHHLASTVKTGNNTIPEIVSLSRQRTPVATAMSCSRRDRTRPSSQSCACMLCRAAWPGVSSVLCVGLACHPGWVTT